MIGYVKGDLLRSDCKLIAHGVNAQGVMGSGVAKAIKEIFPYAYEGYIMAHKNGQLKLGEVIFAGPAETSGLIRNRDPIVANCVTQEFFGKGLQIDYDAIRMCMKTLNRSCAGIVEKIGMPMIGAGLGGGDWGKISVIINEEIDIPVTVYQL